LLTSTAGRAKWRGLRRRHNGGGPVKFGYLDGLRGLAAAIVVVDHFAIAFFQGATDATIRVHHGALEGIILNTPLHLIVSGNFSVCIFFVLSGFVLSAKFFRTGDRRVVVASAFRRYMRLELPVLASVLLAYAVISWHLLHNQAAGALIGTPWLGELWSFQPSLTGALYHAVVGVFADGKSPYNSVLWTMQMELVGSFLVFGVLLAVGRWRYRWAVYVALGGLLVNSYLLAFVAGMAICDWYFGHEHGPRLRARWWVPLVAGSLLLGSSPVGSLAGTMFGGLPDWLGHGMGLPPRMHLAGAIGLVFALVATPLLQRPLEGRMMRYLGRTSFGLYLTHLLVIGTFSSWLFATLAPTIGYLPGFGMMLIPSLVVIGLVAYGFSRWVDEPAIRLSGALYRRYFPARWRIQAGAAEPAAQTVP
jgi:peptidoglycan/LPS O-acetylase OafA/YrhL